MAGIFIITSAVVALWVKYVGWPALIEFAERRFEDVYGERTYGDWPIAPSVEAPADFHSAPVTEGVQRNHGAR